MILIESSLSSIPNYRRTCYRRRFITKWTLLELIFFWHGPNLKRKYHMTSWERIATPKRVGGLGFTNTRVMNKCLLSKWIFKVERGDNSICCNLLRNKYLNEKGFLAVIKGIVPSFGKAYRNHKTTVIEGRYMW